jgi:hypothetical protein
MFFLFEYIDPFIFLLALCVGLFYTYITADAPQVILRYPTPFNAGKLTYMDKNNTCYKYAIEQASCPLDKTLIKTYQFQHQK